MKESSVGIVIVLDLILSVMLVTGEMGLYDGTTMK